MWSSIQPAKRRLSAAGRRGQQQTGFHRLRIRSTPTADPRCRSRRWSVDPPVCRRAPGDGHGLGQRHRAQPDTRRHRADSMNNGVEQPCLPCLTNLAETTGQRDLFIVRCRPALGGPPRRLRRRSYVPGPASMAASPRHPPSLWAAHIHTGSAWGAAARGRLGVWLRTSGHLLWRSTNRKIVNETLGVFRALLTDRVAIFCYAARIPFRVRMGWPLSSSSPASTVPFALAMWVPLVRGGLR
jgi:hypothetical protein